jgi:hypothetical protein
MSTTRTRPGAGLTLLQMMKLVAFGAAVSVCLIPAVHGVFGRLGTPIAIVVFELIAIPLALAITGLLILRRGIFKDWFVIAMLALVIASILGYMAINTVVILRLVARSRQQLPPGFSRVWTGFAAISSILIPALTFLVWRLIPARCPSCGKRRLFLEGKGPRKVEGPGRPRLARCIRCRIDFARLAGRWSQWDEAHGVEVGRNSTANAPGPENAPARPVGGATVHPGARGLENSRERPDDQGSS